LLKTKKHIYYEKKQAIIGVAMGVDAYRDMG
jgi:hypothetical protein